MPVTQIPAGQMLEDMGNNTQKEHVKASPEQCTRNCLSGSPKRCLLALGGQKIALESLSVDQRSLNN